jgi:hypothetical protein
MRMTPTITASRTTLPAASKSCAVSPTGLMVFSLRTVSNVLVSDPIGVPKDKMELTGTTDIQLINEAEHFIYIGMFFCKRRRRLT